MLERTRGLAFLSAHARFLSLSLALALAAAACTGRIGEPSRGGGGSASSPGSVSGSGMPAGSGVTPVSAPLLPARIRRITDAEFDSSVKALLGIDATYGAGFVPDSRQDGFVVNDAQRVDPVFAQQLDSAAQELAAKARANVGQLAPCPTTDPMAGEACARAFLATFAAKAYRRPPTPQELDALVAIYHAGADGLTFAEGFEAIVQAVLQSPGFLYVTEIGDGSATPLPALTPYETASAISYLITGGPPDDALAAAAASNQLTTGPQRVAHARRLSTLPTAAAQVVRVVEQWLGIESIVDTAKDSAIPAYAGFTGLRASMKKEADDFITATMGSPGGTVADLLGADWTIADANLAMAYHAPPAGQGGRVSLAGVPRRGILNQAAFLSVYARAQETAPVKRGVAVMRRIACIDVAAPTTLKINIVPPMPDPNKTTRQRFDIHQNDPVCAGCHKSIDAFGFAFENFDAMGMIRSTEDNLPIDSSTVVATGADFDGTYPDSSALMTRMAKSPSVASCFARHLLKFAAARSDESETPVEHEFMKVWQALPPAAQGNLGEVLAAWVGSDAFVQRRFVP
ncbi:MAG: DUF1588 domain-containing protein [Myxococcota bacterium]|nr:DUF1588 domain-containing protein [Myxococcota bacterium]